MKYENAKDILPSHLLEELQQYAAGRLLYVPAIEERRGWGENSGLREKLKKRNIMIRNKYAHGLTITELADEYYLSLDSIKKIIYSVHKNEDMTYRNTIRSAVAYADAGMFEEWIESYTIFNKNNECISIIEHQPSLFGVVKLPLRLIHTANSYDIKIEKTWDKCGILTKELPPLIVRYQQGRMQCIAEQKNFFLGLKNSGRNAYPTIIMIPEKADNQKFRELFGNVLFYLETKDLETI